MRFKVFLSSCFFALAFISCATGSNFLKLDRVVEQDQYLESVELLESSRSVLYSGEKDDALYYLDKGLLTHYARLYEESSALLENGEQAIADAFTKSITQGVGSYLLNDNVLDYAGEDYEDIYINAFNALNYHQRGEDEDAMVEIRRMNNKLEYLSDKYNVLTSEIQRQALAEGAAEIPANLDGSSNFSNSALARFLGMLFYRANGLEDDARIDGEEIKLAFANSPTVYKHPVPSSISGELDIPPGMARINVIAFSGLSPVKEASTIRIPLPGARWAKISLPEMVSRPSAVGRIEVVFDEGRRFTLELLEDMDAVAQETFKNKRNFIYIKTVLRATVKAASSSAMSVASEKTEGTAGVVLGILSLATQVLAEASEQADVRISRYFPGRAWVGGINIEPGIYSFRVDFYGSSGKLIASREYTGVDVREKDLNLIEAVCLR